LGVDDRSKDDLRAMARKERGGPFPPGVRIADEPDGAGAFPCGGVGQTRGVGGEGHLHDRHQGGNQDGHQQDGFQADRAPLALTGIGHGPVGIDWAASLTRWRMKAPAASAPPTSEMVIRSCSRVAEPSSLRHCLRWVTSRVRVTRRTSSSGMVASSWVGKARNCVLFLASIHRWLISMVSSWAV